MYTGSCAIDTYWATPPKSDTAIEVIREGRLGQGFGSVRCIETGRTWNTYGFDMLPPAGKVVMSYQLQRA